MGGGQRACTETKSKNIRSYLKQHFAENDFENQQHAAPGTLTAVRRVINCSQFEITSHA